MQETVIESYRSSWDDLPDEILLMIFKVLDHVGVLCSFNGLNERLTRIVRDRIFVKPLSDKSQVTCFVLTVTPM